ncbi:MAG: TIGR03087 family PEP-CTERM/XrtA system glycosyltransferase [Rhodospirillales bacterium]|nr:TIGR03087 family PEP-CTERM/XrtA system glycosyltransferase [Rhodospirillales bacterium]
MRDLLFISHRIPYPLNKGEKIRGYNLLRHLGRSYRVHLGCLIDDPADRAHVAHLREVCAEVEGFEIDKRRQKLKALARFRPGWPLMLEDYRHPGLQRWVTATLARTRMDVVYIYSAAMAPYALDAAAPARVLDMQDIDSEKWTRYAETAGWPMRAVWAREGRTLLAYERRAAMACDVTFFVSEPETRRFAELAPETRDRITWVENGVDLEGFSPAHAFDRPFAEPGPHLVFTGNMDYWPNADAVAWFAAEVLPLLRRRPAPPEFHIVGANPGPDVRRLAALPGVRVTGRVPDVRPYVAHADVSVSPLRMARGIQNKVLEAMALGRPVVASPQAFEGVRAEASRDLLVADGAGPMAEAVAAVLDGAHPGLGAAGRAAVERGYAWSATLKRLDAVLARSLTPRT